MRFAPSVASLGAERLANHGMELRIPLITAPAGRYQGAPALIPAVIIPSKCIARPHRRGIAEAALGDP